MALFHPREEQLLFPERYSYSESFAVSVTAN